MRDEEIKEIPPASQAPADQMNFDEGPVDPRSENAKFVEAVGSGEKPGTNPLFQAHPLQEVVENQWALDLDFSKAGTEVPGINDAIAVPAEDKGGLGVAGSGSEVTEWETHERYSAHASSPMEIDDGLRTELESIPQKMAFKIGDVSEIVGVKQYVLRYWEAEFEQVRPKKSKFNQRMYSRRDVETLLLIKKLLYRDRFSMEGARKVLSSFRKKVKTESVQNDKVASAIDLTHELVRDISTLKHWLKA